MQCASAMTPRRWTPLPGPGWEHGGGTAMPPLNGLVPQCPPGIAPAGSAASADEALTSAGLALVAPGEQPGLPLSAARQHAVEVEALVSSHGAALAEARPRWEEELALAVAARAKAEGVGEQARAELARAQAAHDEAVGALRAESTGAIERARAEVTEMLSARYGAELDSVKARAEGQLAKQTAKAEGAAELANARAAEVDRLAAHIEELRTELARTRQGQGTGSAPSVRKSTKQPAQAPRQRRQAKPRLTRGVTAHVRQYPGYDPAQCSDYREGQSPYLLPLASRLVRAGQPPRQQASDRSELERFSPF